MIRIMLAFPASNFARVSASGSIHALSSAHKNAGRVLLLSQTYRFLVGILRRLYLGTITIKTVSTCVSVADYF